MTGSSSPVATGEAFGDGLASEDPAVSPETVLEPLSVEREPFEDEDSPSFEASEAETCVDCIAVSPPALVVEEVDEAVVGVDEAVVVVLGSVS